MPAFVLALSFSYDKELLFAATTSGDYMIGSMKARRIKKTVQATKQGLGAIACFRGGLVVGGGDGTLTTFDDIEPFTARSKTTLDGSAVIGVSLSSDQLEVNLLYDYCCFSFRQLIIYFLLVAF